MTQSGRKDSGNNVLAGPAAAIFAMLVISTWPVLLAFTAFADTSPPAAWPVLRAALAVAAVGFVLWLVLVTRSTPKQAALAVTLGAIALHLYQIVLVAAGAAVMSPNVLRVTAAVYLALTLALVWLTSRGRVRNELVFAFPFALSLVIAGTYVRTAWAVYGPPAAAPVGFADAPSAGLTTAQDLRPDVYHIVLDGFGRPDVLRGRYGLELASFVSELRSLGFEIDETRGLANYVQTSLSVPSMLSMSYLDVHDRAATSRAVPQRAIQESPVFHGFKRVGYEVVFVGSNVIATTRHGQADECVCDAAAVGEFESAVIRQTIFRDLGLADLDYRSHRNAVRRAFSAFEHLRPASKPRFVFAHIMVPHPPYVFDAVGNAIAPPMLLSFNDGNGFRGTPEEYQRGYRAQAQFAAAALLQTVRTVEANSRAAGRESVIIVHGDHGPRLHWDVSDARRTDATESLPVLLAIKWASGGGTIGSPRSLVNVYRSLFARYFSAPVDLLPDRAFVSSYQKPYDLIEVDITTLKPLEHGAGQKGLTE